MRNAKGKGDKDKEDNYSKLVLMGLQRHISVANKSQQEKIDKFELLTDKSIEFILTLINGGIKGKWKISSTNSGDPEFLPTKEGSGVKHAADFILKAEKLEFCPVPLEFVRRDSMNAVLEWKNVDRPHSAEEVNKIRVRVPNIKWWVEDMISYEELQEIAAEQQKNLQLLNSAATAAVQPAHPPTPNPTLARPITPVQPPNQPAPSSVPVSQVLLSQQQIAFQQPLVTPALQSPQHPMPRKDGQGVSGWSSRPASVMVPSNSNGSAQGIIHANHSNGDVSHSHSHFAVSALSNDNNASHEEHKEFVKASPVDREFYNCRIELIENAKQRREVQNLYNMALHILREEFDPRTMILIVPRNIINYLFESGLWEFLPVRVQRDIIINHLLSVEEAVLFGGLKARIKEGPNASKIYLFHPIDSTSFQLFGEEKPRFLGILEIDSFMTFSYDIVQLISSFQQYMELPPLLLGELKFRPPASHFYQKLIDIHELKRYTNYYLHLFSALEGLEPDKYVEILEQNVELETQSLMWLDRSVSEKHFLKFNKELYIDVSAGTRLKDLNRLCKLQSQCFYLKTPIKESPFETVYCGVKDNTPVAVKKLKTKERNMFDNEVMILKTMRGKGIVPFYGSLEKNGEFYIFTRLMEGTLAELIQHWKIQRTFIRDGFCLIIKHLISSIARCIASVHHVTSATPFIHCDLKPTNIMFSNSKFYLSEFTTTIIKQLKDGLPFTDSPSVTNYYEAPETKHAHLTYSEKTDIYSLGVIVYEIMVGKTPMGTADIFDAEEAKLKFQDRRSFGDRLKGFSNCDYECLKHLAEWMIQTEIKDRPSVDQVLSHPFFWSGEDRATLLEQVGTAIKDTNGAADHSPLLSFNVPSPIFGPWRGFNESLEFTQHNRTEADWGVQLNDREMVNVLLSKKYRTEDWRHFLKLARVIAQPSSSDPNDLRTKLKLPENRAFLVEKVPGFFVRLYDELERRRGKNGLNGFRDVPNLAYLYTYLLNRPIAHHGNVVGNFIDYYALRK